MDFVNSPAVHRSTPTKRRTCYEFHMDNMEEALAEDTVIMEDTNFSPRILALYLLDLRDYRDNCRGMSPDQLNQFDERFRDLEKLHKNLKDYVESN